MERCYGAVCFFPLEASAPRFFGFSEFLAGLALMVLAWTTADVRYRFRIRTAPLPLQGLTFFVVATVGGLSLLTDLWRAEQWLVPRGNLFTPATWQALLGGSFLLTFLTWAWFAFIRPPVYGKLNAQRFAQALYRIVLKGSPDELAIIAEELTFSAAPLVSYATDLGRLKNYHIMRDEVPRKRVSKVEAYANDLLLLLGDKRLCRSIVAVSPGTALAIFQEIQEMKKFGIQVETFGCNIVTEALLNADSFLFNETESYESGLIGYHKPLSQAIFSNYEMVENIGTLLDPNIDAGGKWTAAQLGAYCRAVKLTLGSYAKGGYRGHSFVLYRAKSNIEHAASDVYLLDGTDEISFDDQVLARLRVVIEFIVDAVSILDEHKLSGELQLRIRKTENGGLGTFYDHLAEMIFEVIFAASAVTSPHSQCWWVQHNTVWSSLFNFNRLQTTVGKIVKFKVRRLMYDEIVRMHSSPNFKGAKILGFCLNVMGLKLGNPTYDRDSRALHRAVLAWTKRNFSWLNSYNHRVAEASLVDSLTYEPANQRLVKTYAAGGLRREPTYVYLDLDPLQDSTTLRSSGSDQE
ncbi:hypothetical protein [Rhizobacter sp. Root16D2]|uniref:hypothetical protein n=1 Tax=Rhizobacter sp. Root16D2 TaxID=1736479 RepID=UPI0009180B32|nr:hypothetical protein [Rhizobacter sp. Root16D2]SHN40335.1 hypothetical protein SAMN02787076_06216 [Rhizobacter sp. OV335]